MPHHKQPKEEVLPNKCLEPLSNPFFGNNIKNLLEENLINQLINESSDM